MKLFNLAAAKFGSPVCTNIGEPVEIIKHEGWVNVYKSNDCHEDLDSFALYQMQQGIFETKDEALRAVKKTIKYSTYIATVKIEWEE